MRLLIIGSLGGQIGEASQIAASRGALVSQPNDVEAGLNSLRPGQEMWLLGGCQLPRLNRVST